MENKVLEKVNKGGRPITAYLEIWWRWFIEG
jgi:hypothetical protein